MILPGGGDFTEDQLIGRIASGTDTATAQALVSIMRRIPEAWGVFLAVGPGWYPIVIELDEKIRAVDPAYEVHQIKEKFGSLRYYFSSQGRMDLREDVRAAEALSFRTCEECGTTEGVTTAPRGHGSQWIVTLCPACRAEPLKSRWEDKT